VEHERLNVPVGVLLVHVEGVRMRLVRGVDVGVVLVQQIAPITGIITVMHVTHERLNLMRHSSVTCRKVVVYHSGSVSSRDESS